MQQIRAELTGNYVDSCCNIAFTLIDLIVGA
jgi:hypothetical protein